MPDAREPGSSPGELIAALERASEGSRILDAKIAEAVNPGCEILPGGATLYIAHKGHKLCAEVPRFSTSIDAALALKPADIVWWEVRQFYGPDSPMRSFAGHDGMFTAKMGRTFGDDSIRGSHDKPALALCIAAVKARSTSATQKQE